MMLSGSFTFQSLPPAWPDAPLRPLLYRPLEVLLRSAVALPVPDDELLKRSGLPGVLEELDELVPVPDVELASLRGDELLEELPLLDPVPVLLPDAPAPLAPDSRTSDTITSGAACVCGNVTTATANPFWIPLELLIPELDDDELRSADDEAPIPLLDEDEL